MNRGAIFDGSRGIYPTENGINELCRGATFELIPKIPLLIINPMPDKERQKFLLQTFSRSIAARFKKNKVACRIERKSLRKFRLA